MINKKNKIKEESNLSSFSDNKCDKKIAKLNKKLEETIEQLQEIKNLYAEAEWETLTKEKKLHKLLIKLKN